MAITPSSIRADAFIGNKKLNCGPNSKPCGNVCIPRSHKCRASWNKPVKAAAAIGAAAGVGLVATAFLHKRPGMRSAARASIEPLAQAGFAAGNVARGNWTGAAKNVANVGMTGRDLPKNLKTVAQGYGTDIKNLVNRGRNAAFKAKHHRQATRSADFTWEEWRGQAPKAGSTASERAAWREAFYKNTPGAKPPRRDSIWAQGFQP
jgi:hypothetical protein